MESGFEKCTTATGCQAGGASGGAGELWSADGIAAAANGDLYVTEFNDHRVSQFTANGDFVRAWGFDVDPAGGAGFEKCNSGSGCKPGVGGSGPGQMTSPNSVAVAGGEVYVTDTAEHRVDRFTTAGDPDGSFGSFGTGAGKLSGPRGVAIAPGGNVLVAENTNSRVSEFTSTGAFVRAWGFGVDTGTNAFETCTALSTCQAGLAGAAAGQLSDDPPGIATDALGDIFLADDTNNRIAQYAPSPAFTRAWGFDAAPPDDAVNVFEECTLVTGCQQAAADFAPGGLEHPDDLSVDSAGRVLVADFGTDRVVRYADPPPPTPAITDTNPHGPSNDPNPAVKGTAAAGLTVKIYGTADCTGPPLATGAPATFASPGITTPVPSNATTNLRATASDAFGNPSSCSAPFSYTEDSTPPGVVLTGTDPGSPANENSPKVIGSAEAGSEVRLFTTGDCSGVPAATGSAGDLAAGIALSVPDDSTTQVRAIATDQVGNASACSAPITYVESSTLPDTTAPNTTISTPKAKVKTRKKSAKVSFTLGSTEP